MYVNTHDTRQEVQRNAWRKFTQESSDCGVSLERDFFRAAKQQIRLDCGVVQVSFQGNLSRTLPAAQKWGSKIVGAQSQRWGYAVFWHAKFIQETGYINEAFIGTGWKHCTITCKRLFRWVVEFLSYSSRLKQRAPCRYHSVVGLWPKQLLACKACTWWRR